MRVGRHGRRERDRGAVAVMSVFFVLLLLTFLAVTINVGALMRTRGDLQHASDSAALAAVENMITKPAGAGLAIPSSNNFDFAVAGSAPDVARVAAEAFTVMDWSDQKPIFNPAADIQFGFWHLDATDPCMFSSGSCGAGWEAAPSPLTNVFQMFVVNSAATTVRFPVPRLFAGILTNKGTTTLEARSTALGRRARVRCALPIALSICQLLDAGGNFIDCSAGPVSREFTSEWFEDTPGQTIGRWALGRIDMNGTATGVDTANFLRQFVRHESYHHCEYDPAGTEYQVGLGRVPMDRPKTKLAPIIHAMSGIEEEGGMQNPGRCMFGNTYVVPVVRPSWITQPSDCPVMTPPDPVPTPPDPPFPLQPTPPATHPRWPVEPPPGSPVWPPSGGQMQMVVGFVNMVVTGARCGQAAPQFLDATNCETPLAMTCTSAETANIRLFAQISCNGPAAAPWPPNEILHSRLLR